MSKTNSIDKIRKSIFDMVNNVSDEKKLERIHSLVQLLYTKK